MLMDNYWDAYEYIPIIISYDEILDMWSYSVGDIAGVADTKDELLETVWMIIRTLEEEGTQDGKS